MDSTTLIVRFVHDASADPVCVTVHNRNHASGVQLNDASTTLEGDFAFVGWVIFVVETDLDKLGQANFDALSEIFPQMTAAYMRLTFILNGSGSITILPLDLFRNIDWLEMNGELGWDGDARIETWFNAKKPLPIMHFSHMHPQCFSLTNDFNSLLIVTGVEAHYRQYIRMVYGANIKQLHIMLVDAGGNRVAMVEQISDGHQKSLQVTILSSADIDLVAHFLLRSKFGYDNANIHITEPSMFAEAWTALRTPLIACKNYHVHDGDQEAHFVIVDGDVFEMRLTAGEYIVPPDNGQWKTIHLFLSGQFGKSSLGFKLLVEWLAGCEHVQDLAVESPSADLVEQVILLKERHNNDPQLQPICTFDELQRARVSLHDVDTMLRLFALEHGISLTFGTADFNKATTVDSEVTKLNDGWTKGTTTTVTEMDPPTTYFQYTNDARMAQLRQQHAN